MPLDGLEVSVVGVADNGDPNVIRYSFGSPLEDPARRWIHFVDGVWQPFAPPAVGETLLLEAPRGALDLLY